MEKQILEILLIMQNDLGYMKNDMTNVQKDLRYMKNDMKGVQNDLIGVKKDVKEMRVELTDLKEGQNRLETGLGKLQKNLVDSLALYTDKIVNHYDNKTEVLNKRIFRVETELERLGRQ